MTDCRQVFLNDVGVCSSLGSGTQQLKQNIAIQQATFLSETDAFGTEKLLVGRYPNALPAIPFEDTKWHSRNNQLALAVYQQIEEQITEAVLQYGANRIGVVIGTSTSGIADAEPAIAEYVQGRPLPPDYHYSLQEMANTAEFIAKVAQVTGPVYAISTACSSGAKALASAKRLIEADLCDVVISGGVDTLCQLTLQGFSALEAVSPGLCMPFSANRNGINIGEAGALFIVSKQQKGVQLSGIGESSDAHHISAPHPEGNGAEQSMRAALTDANRQADQIDYINLHGTATILNDQMESLAVNRVFPPSVLCSSTKPLTGHTLGAAGALEAAICWLTLTENKFLPVHHWDEKVDPALPLLNFVSTNAAFPSINCVMSNSFAFGGNNVSLVMERLNDS